MEPGEAQAANAKHRLPSGNRTAMLRAPADGKRQIPLKVFTRRSELGGIRQGFTALHMASISALLTGGKGIAISRHLHGDLVQL